MVKRNENCNMKKLRYLFLAGLLVIAVASCTKFKGDQEIPAYMCIKPWTLITNYDNEGADTEAITDAWIYVDGNVHGCFEIRPKENDTSVTVPILTKGKHTVTLYPGIKMNGIASTRIQYPFYRPFVIENYEFTPGKTDTVYPSTTYYSVDEGQVKFKLMEDFESLAMKFSKADDSDTTIYRVSWDESKPHYDPLAWTGNIDKSKYSGKVTLCDTIDYFCILSERMNDLPKMGNYILLELDYRCDVEFEVGLYALTQNGYENFELVWVRPSSEWKKIYINLGPTVTDNQTATWWKLFIAGSTVNGETANFYFDNIKVVYRD